MDDISQDNRSVFDLSDDELNRRMAIRLEQLKRDRFAKNLPISYKDENCISDDLIVHEYKDGSRFLVSVDIDSGDTTIVRQLDNA